MLSLAFVPAVSLLRWRLYRVSLLGLGSAATADGYNNLLFKCRRIDSAAIVLSWTTTAPNN